VATEAQGQPARAAELLERALAIYERKLGPEHPLVARELHTLGNAHVDNGQIELGVGELRRAQAIREVALGPEHPVVASNLTDLARALRASHHDDEALALDRRAVAIGARALGPDHPLYAEQLSSLGATLGRMGHYAEAAEQLHRAEAIFIKVHGPEHDSVARVHGALAELMILQSRWREAAALYDLTIPALAKAQDVGDWLIVARINLACAALELHQPARALSAVEPLVRELAAQKPRIAGYVQFVTARALWESGADRARIRALVADARARLIAAGAVASNEVAELDAWLKQHPGARPPGP
jgi:tetratricopeptide (TPR) repeat protein